VWLRLTLLAGRTQQRCFEPCLGKVAQVSAEALKVAPIYPGRGRQLAWLTGFPRPRMRYPRTSSAFIARSRSQRVNCHNCRQQSQLRGQLQFQPSVRAWRLCREYRSVCGHSSWERCVAEHFSGRSPANRFPTPLSQPPSIRRCQNRSACRSFSIAPATPLGQVNMRFLGNSGEPTGQTYRDESNMRSGTVRGQLRLRIQREGCSMPIVFPRREEMIPQIPKF